MKHGKHVLCEKPMGINKGEVEEMIDCAKDNNVFLMEGLWSRFNPALLKMKSELDSGAIGEIRYIQADFAFNAGNAEILGGTAGVFRSVSTRRNAINCRY